MTASRLATSEKSRCGCAAAALAEALPSSDVDQLFVSRFRGMQGGGPGRFCRIMDFHAQIANQRRIGFPTHRAGMLGDDLRHHRQSRARQGNFLVVAIVLGHRLQLCGQIVANSLHLRVQDVDVDQRIPITFVSLGSFFCRGRDFFGSTAGYGGRVLRFCGRGGIQSRVRNGRNWHVVASSTGRSPLRGHGERIVEEHVIRNVAQPFAAFGIRVDGDSPFQSLNRFVPRRRGVC